MFTLIFAAALAAAAPAQAAAPADAHKDHAQHGQMDHGSTKHEGHDMACCKDGKAGCCKDKSKMDCCKEAEAKKPAAPETHDHQH